MSSRRNLLLSYLANSYKWLPYSFEKINNSLIPTTISGKNVKNKLRFTKLYANGEIINGSYRGTDISEVSSEPYNLFDEEWELGNYDSSGNPTTTPTTCRSINYIKVIAGKTYSFESGTLTSTSTNARYVMEYDENKNFIQRSSIGNLSQSIRTITLTENTHFVKISYYVSNKDFTNDFPTDTCFHLTGIRTGYAPYKTFSPIALKYQGNGNTTDNDSLEITTSEFIFTKNVDYVDSATLPITRQTPQVIRIPRKHLEVVKIRDLSWSYDSNLKVFHNDSFVGKSQGGIYCSSFMTNTNLYASNLVDLTMTNRPYYTQHNICIKDLAIVSTDDFLNKYGDYYIFYETTDEVEEMPFEIEVESGGTINTNSEVKPNADVLLKCK